jgi:Tfp pilus assembly protein PilF
VATLLALGALAVVAVRAARAGDRRLLAALGWFAVTFAPASNLVTATPQILTERTLYGPSIALAFCAALLISAIASSPRVSLLPTSAFLHRAAVAATAILIVATGLRTLHYTAVWRSNEAVFRQMIIADSASYRGYWKLAGYAKSRNQFDESLSLYERAYRLYPRDRQLLADYAQTLLDQGQPRRAATIARQLMTWPEVRRMPNVVSLYLAALGQAYGADSVIRAGSDLFAAERVPTAALFVGAAHEARGDSNAAEQSYRAGLDIAPTDTALRRRLAVVQKPQR